jgi:hypothetical protein
MLPRLTASVAIADATGRALREFTRFWDAICTAIEEQTVNIDGSVPMTGPLTLASYTVATLPAVGAGQVAYASNGRKNGEGGGAGTGVMVFSDATAWRACDTGATVAA